MSGAGLLWYGQNYLIYPSAFPPGSRIGSRVWLCLKPLMLIKVNYPDVPVPSDFGMPYQDLELRTPDGILLRCYLLPQRKTLHADHSEAVRVPYDGPETDDEVNPLVLLRDASDILLIYSLLPPGQLLSCFMEMGGILATESHLPKYFS